MGTPGAPRTINAGSVASFHTAWSTLRERVVADPPPPPSLDKNDEPNLRVRAIVRSTASGVLFGRPFRFAASTARTKFEARITSADPTPAANVAVERAVIAFPSSNGKIHGWGTEYFFFCKDDRLPIGVDLRALAPEPEEQLVAACKTRVKETPDPTDTTAACVRERKEAYYATNPKLTIAAGESQVACDPLRHFIIRQLIVTPQEGRYPRIWARVHVSGPSRYEILNGGFAIPIEKYIFRDLAERARASLKAKEYLARIVAANNRHDVTPVVELIAAVLDGNIP